MKQVFNILSIFLFATFFTVANAQYSGNQNIEGLEFSVEAIGNNVLLNWSALDSDSIEAIEVERSTDGKYFIPIYQTYSISKQSSYSDAIFGQTSLLYYRMNITYKNGELASSLVKSIDLNDGKHLKPIVYSNSSNVTVEFYSKKSASTSLYIFNTTSRMVDEKSLMATQGENRLTFDSSNLQRGLYFIQINQGGETTTTKFFVQ